MTTQEAEKAFGKAPVAGATTISWKKAKGENALTIKASKGLKVKADKPLTRTFKARKKK